MKKRFSEEQIIGFLRDVSSTLNLTQGQQLGVDPPLVALALFREGHAEQRGDHGDQGVGPTGP